MRVEPRQQLLEIWQAVIRHSYPDDKWQWGGRDGSNSISDAEQLLCILGPATEIDAFTIDEPDRMAKDVQAVLRPLGGLTDIPLRLIEAVDEYLQKYTDESGTPIFSCDSYFGVSADADDKTLLPRQRNQPVVDSFAISLSLSLAAIGFARQFRESVKRRAILDKLDDVEARASKRLTAAMVGLLRCFTVNIFDVDSRDGRALCRTVNQSRLSDRRIVTLLHKELREIRASLRDVTIGSGAGLAEDLELPDRLFECGWGWGIIRDAPAITTRADVGEQQEGMAEPAPYIYFTVVALDAIEALFSERTRLLGLLTEEQQRLAQGLQLRWDLTQSYWSKIAVADFGGVRWPLEDIPWQRTTEKETEYFSLHVSSIVVQDLVRKRARDTDLDRVGRVLEELANRSRITRRVFGGDEAYQLHAPGFTINLNGSDEDGGPRLTWVMSDFAPLLLQRTISLAGLLGDPELRGRMLTLADQIWAHLHDRRLRDEDRRGLWDQPAQVFPPFTTEYDKPSWYYTKRVVDGLMTAADVITSPPLRSTSLTEEATYLLSEADHLFDRELLKGSPSGGQAIRGELQELRIKLDRAWAIRDGRPGTAVALANEILLRLDRFAAARDDDVDGGF
ncbi:SCO2524 family protein [Actinoplanes solisilvae]|uniref:SCO2524 family protein n=1 Tax=Actinoplanes solisilvae TaxID=2486853 RepID=UPI000FD71C34|nr:SCO2524 family protein [Actinoplanes solisilvae]